jgi:hypothetical protein
MIEEEFSNLFLMIRERKATMMRNKNGAADE